MRYIRLSGVLLLAACGDGGTTPTSPPTPPTPVETSIALSATSLSFSSLGVTHQLTATVKDQNGATMSGASVSWVTSDASIATVSSTGLVTAVANGSATIQVTSGTANAGADVTVLQLTASIELAESALTFTSLGDTTQLLAEVKDAAGTVISNAVVTWSSSDAAVATVSTTGLLTSVANGVATITATSGSASATVSVAVERGWVSISAGLFHSCGLTTSGDGYCWGYNANGRLGDGTTTGRLIPALVSGGYEWKSISAGGHSCGVTTAGDAYCWGDNDSGQLGDGTTTGRKEPVQVSGGHTWASVSSGTEYTCGLTTAGDAYCWGENSDGVLGDGTTTDRSIPTLVAGGYTWVSVDSGTRHTCGATTEGDGYCWGWDFWGQGGVGGRWFSSSTPRRREPTTTMFPKQKVKGLSSFASMSSGGIHSCGITTGSEGYCWGNSESGQVGNGSFPPGRVRIGSYTYTHDYGPMAPEIIKGLHTWTSVSAGDSHTCGVKTTNEVYCWGLNANGRLGINSTTLEIATPSLVYGGHTWTSVSAGGAHACGVTTAGEAYCWGSSEAGQLGNGSENNSGIPAKVSWN